MDKLVDKLLAQIEEWQYLVNCLKFSAPHLHTLADTIAELICNKRTLICGNGGSASQAQHFAGELVGRYRQTRRPLNAVALSSDGAVLTCIANDFGIDPLFARQVEGLGATGDLLIALSTSGRSPNILHALQAAHTKGMRTLALLGRDGGIAKDMAEFQWTVPSTNTARIQEVHLLIIHLICEKVDSLLLGKE